MENTSSDQITTWPRLPVTYLKPGKYQPRRDMGDLESLTESIRLHGVMSPILIRPLPLGSETPYEIVAGERRWRSSINAFGKTDENMVPVMIRVLSDAEAMDAALIENIERKPMNVVEEAEACARVLADCKGDHDEAARRLSMRPDAFRKRLGLMACTADVRVALVEKKILLGHAELLAGMRKEAQEQALKLLLDAANQPTVAQFKTLIEQRAQSLTAAIFDKEECAGCPHNSGTQQALFGTAIAEGNCTNSSCYKEKTETELTKRADALKEDYQVVRIIRPGDNYSITSLRPDGARGVGTEQAQACRSCQNFGAAVSSLPDSLGAVYRNQCMDMACNTKMVAARMRADKEAQAQADASTGPVGSEPSDATADEKKAKTSVSSAAATPKQSTAPTAYGRAVVEYREQVWRQVLTRVVVKAEPVLNRCILIALLCTRPSRIDDSKLREALGKVIPQIKDHSPGDVLASIMDSNNQQLQVAMQHLPAYTSSQLPVSEVTGLLKTLSVKLEDHWVLNEEFLKLLTKAEIDAMCGEIGIKKALGDDYTAAINGKKDELIKRVMNVKGFDYTGKVPKSMRW